MTQVYRSPFTRRTLKIMIGNMYPSEMWELTEDRQIRTSDVPEWIEQTLREECKLLIARLPRYEALIEAKYGVIGSLIGKISVWHTVRDNWDGLEPCNFENMKPLRYYFDEHIDEAIKLRISSRQ